MRPWPPQVLAKFERGIPPALLGESADREYYVVFTNPAIGRWWDRLFKHGYRHCYVLVWEGACWLYLDPTAERLHVSILDWWERSHPAEWIEDPNASVAAVHVGAPTGRLRAPWILAPVACTEFVKAILGVRSFLLWTPWRLARYLEKRHVRIVKAKNHPRGKGVEGSAAS